MNLEKYLRDLLGGILRGGFSIKFRASKMEEQI